MQSPFSCGIEKYISLYRNKAKYSCIRLADDPVVLQLE
jgi:hypothetical protein